MKQKNLFSIVIFLLDALCLSGIFYLFTSLRNYSFALPDLFVASVVVTILLVWLAYYVIDAYDSTADMLSLSYTTQHVLATGAAFLSTIIAIYIFTLERSHHFSRSVLPLTFFIFLPISLYYRRIISRYSIDRIKDRCFLVLGVSEIFKEFHEEYNSQSGCRQELRLVEEGGLGDFYDDKSLNGRNELLNSGCDGIVMASDKLSSDVLPKLIDLNFKNIPVMSLESFCELVLRKVYLPSVRHEFFLGTGFLLIDNSVYSHVKRIADIFISLILMLLSIPVLIIAPILIKLESKGSAIFKQERVGKNNVSFILYKFRTMFDGDADGCMYTEENDLRVTKTGRWLRKFRFDELPQLWNVFKGDMSIIGPRAEWVKCTEEYVKEIPYYGMRHLVKPGITGWAQVNYPYGSSVQDAERKLAYDLYYIRHNSLLLDANIILKTIYVVLSGKGAK